MNTLAAMNPVRYLVARGDLPPVSRGGYDYVLAGNGVWKRAANRHVETCRCLASCHVAGLSPLGSSLQLRQGHLPESTLITLLADARRRAWARPVEAMYHVYRDEARTRLVYVAQRSTACYVHYHGGDDPAILLDVHSHCEMGARFSLTDDRDEQGFRFYAVVGKIFTRPEILLRLGVHGDHWLLPVTALFEGPGPFVDLFVSQTDLGDDYGHP